MNIPELIKTSFAEIQPRPFDKYLLGGFMVWYGLRSKQMHKWPRRVMVAAGIYQIIYSLPKIKKLSEDIKAAGGVQNAIGNALNTETSNNGTFTS